MADQFFTIEKDGNLKLNLHKYQERTLYSQAQTTVNLKGWRAGGTSLMPFWLMNEMMRCGPGNPALNYFVAMPTLSSGKKAVLAETVRVFETLYKIGVHNKNANTITTTPDGERKLWGHEQRERTPIVFVYADDPTSFGSMTSIAGTADEIGQAKFRLESWRTLTSRMMTQRGRVAPSNHHPALKHLHFPKDLKCGRVLAASTVWNLGWLEDLWDEYERAVLEAIADSRARRKMLSNTHDVRNLKESLRARWYYGLLHPRLNFIRFESSANPVNSPEELAQLKAAWPDWFYDMRIRALFRKPAGVVFEHWNPARHVWPQTEKWNPDTLPAKWPRRVAIDFGPRNFYALFIAYDEDRDRHIVYRVYHDSQKSNQERAQEILEIAEKHGEKIEWCVAGQISEEIDRTELAIGGLSCIEPRFKPVKPQLTMIAAAVKNDRLFIFKGVAQDFETEMRSLSQPINDEGIVDADALPEELDAAHHVACLRYYASWWFSALFSTFSTSVRAGGEEKRNALCETSVQDGAPVLDAPLVMAGGGLSTYGEIRQQRYGLDLGCFEPHLDLDL